MRGGATGAFLQDADVFGRPQDSVAQTVCVGGNSSHRSPKECELRFGDDVVLRSETLNIVVGAVLDACRYGSR